AELQGRRVVQQKGARAIVLEKCPRRLEATGHVVALTDADRQVLAGQLRDAAGRAMRTLTFAHRDVPPGMPTDEDGLHDCCDALERELIFDGFVAIRDPLRPDVPAAVDDCRRAGIEVKMITGDNIETARAIGSEIGLLDTL